MRDTKWVAIVALFFFFINIFIFTHLNFFSFASRVQRQGSAPGTLELYSIPYLGVVSG